MAIMIFKTINRESVHKSHTSYLWQSKVLVLCSLFLLCSLAACNPEEIPASTNNVEISIDVQKVSAGYAHVTFSTNKRAFYLIGIQAAQADVDPQKVAKHFMLMALDRAYVDYLYWRNQQLQQLTPFIADFASHSLQYGTVDQFFTFLDTDQDYWVYAFVVDHTSNKPAGRLFYQTIHTNDSSLIPIDFHYRVEGAWDYVYPMDSMGEIHSHIPWVGETIDSLTLRQQGWNSPGEYFFHRFTQQYENPDSPVNYGIAAKENDGEGDHTSNIKFEIGKTYYTGMATLDAPLVYPLPEHVYDIYRFTWQGDTTNIYLTPADTLNGLW